MGRGRKPCGRTWWYRKVLASARYRADQQTSLHWVGPAGPAPEGEVAVGRGVRGRTPGLEHMYTWWPWLGPDFFTVHITHGSLWPPQRVMGKGPPAQTSRVRSLPPSPPRPLTPWPAPPPLCPPPHLLGCLESQGTQAPNWEELGDSWRVAGSSSSVFGLCWRQPD